MVTHGETSLLEPPNGRRRPVLIVSCSEVISVVRNLVGAPIPSTTRAIPTNVGVGRAERIEHDSVASFDSLATVPNQCSRSASARSGPGRRHELCAAMAAVAVC